MLGEHKKLLSSFINSRNSSGQKKERCICASDPSWIEASDEHGLSFSATLKHTVGTMEFLGGFQKKGTKIRWAYWILEDNKAIPDDLKFIQDPDNPAHYLLAVTKRMHINELVSKLNFMSQRMAVMNDLQLEAYKNA